MTKRTHYCNVCRYQIRGDGDSFGKDGYGFRFDHAASGWSQQAIQHAENHICHPCLMAANAFANVAKSE